MDVVDGPVCFALMSVQFSRCWLSSWGIGPLCCLGAETPRGDPGSLAPCICGGGERHGVKGVGPAASL